MFSMVDVFSQEVKRAKKRTLPKIDFTKFNQDDFNNDGIADQLICNNIKINKKNRINVEVIDGSTKKPIFKWNWNEKNAQKNKNVKIRLTGCDVIYLRENRPSVVLSLAYNSKKIGMRVKAPQFILFNRPSNNKLAARKILIPGTKKSFLSAARNVKCAQVPEKLLNAAVKNGAYCFFPGYDNRIKKGTWGTFTSFVKFEQGEGDSFIVKDLTKSSRLPWSGGMKGTSMKKTRPIKMCNGVRKYDLLHMMDGAFLDFNNDRLIDLVTVGQHASVRAHQMVYNPNFLDKFYFRNTLIDDVHNGGMSEFLSVSSLDEHDKSIKSSCVYISGERYNGCGSVPDHLRCFKDGEWKEIFPQGKKFSSKSNRISVKRYKNTNGYFIEAPIVKRKNIIDSYRYFYIEE